MKHILWVGLGGFLGASSRFATGVWLTRVISTNFPTATFLVNFIGCILLGALVNVGLDKQSHLPVNEFLAIGVLGGFTTFSTFGLESFHLLRDGNYNIAIVYILGSVLMGLLGIWIGMSVSRFSL